jgi:hypothetical protein
MTNPSQLLLSRLEGARDRIKMLQLNFAFGELMMALQDAAAQGVSLNEQHRAVAAEIQQLGVESWAKTLGLDTDIADSRRRGEPLLSIDGYVPRAEAALKALPYTDEKVADVYDADDYLREALAVLFPDFEYPAFSHLSIDQVRAKYERSKRV